MAITTVYTYPLNGSLRDFNIPFEYLARRFVTITLIGQDRKELILANDFRFTSKTTIQTTQPWGPGDGYELIEVRRNTSSTDRLVDFADGSILRAYELNIAQIQTMHIAEEARNMVADTIGVNNDGDLDARARRIVNLADATEPGHAVTLRQEQEWAQSTLGNRNASAVSASAALVSENAAKLSETNSKASENAAKLSETNSKASENAAKLSETNSKASENAAASSAAGLNMPPAVGGALKVLRQKADESGLEYVGALAATRSEWRGTVTQSGGAATGALYETSPWRDGWAVKRADGTFEAVCTFLWGTQSMGMAGVYAFTLPFTAVGVYFVEAVPSSAEGAGSQVDIGSLLYNGIYIWKTPTVCSICSYSYRAAINVPVRVQVRIYGRWH